MKFFFQKQDTQLNDDTIKSLLVQCCLECGSCKFHPLSNDEVETGSSDFVLVCENTNKIISEPYEISNDCPLLTK